MSPVTFRARTHQRRTRLPPPPPTGLLALDVLAGIPVENEHPSGYDRALFPRWLDLGGNGCSTRERY
jgi:hypothetical protein